MMRVEGQDFYTFEPTLVLIDGKEEYRVPIRWFERGGKQHADTWGLTQACDQNGWIVEEHDTKQVPLECFLVSFPFLQTSWHARGILDPNRIVGK
jgi:hypothetical protein